MKYIQDLNKEELKKEFGIINDGNFIYRKSNNRRLGTILISPLSVELKENSTVFKDELLSHIGNYKLGTIYYPDAFLVGCEFYQKTKVYTPNILLASLFNDSKTTLGLSDSDFLVLLEANDIDIHVDISRNLSDYPKYYSKNRMKLIYDKFDIKYFNDNILTNEQILLLIHLYLFKGGLFKYPSDLENMIFYNSEKKEVSIVSDNDLDMEGILELGKTINTEEGALFTAQHLFRHFSRIYDTMSNDITFFLNCYISNIPIFESEEDIFNTLKPLIQK